MSVEVNIERQSGTDVIVYVPTYAAREQLEIDTLERGALLRVAYAGRVQVARVRAMRMHRRGHELLLEVGPGVRLPASVMLSRAWDPVREAPPRGRR